MTKYTHWLNQPDSNVYFVTTTTTEFTPLFADERYVRIVTSAIEVQIRAGRYSLVAYSVMPEHVHLIVKLHEGQEISSVVGALKSWTSHRITEALREDGYQDVLTAFARHARSAASYAVWQQSFRAFPVTTESVLWEKIRYIHNNAVHRGLVDGPEQYAFSSARNYAGMDDCILEVSLI